MEPKFTDKEMRVKYANIMFKTNNKGYGVQSSQVPADQQRSLNRKFTTQWAMSGMYKNEGLNTVLDRDRYMEGSKDWMEKLH